MADGGKMRLRIMFKSTVFISPASRGKGKQAQPRAKSIAAEILQANRKKNGHLAVGACL